MAPKRRFDTKATHKAEVHEKVKEIKQRQQNWFKQRDSALKTNNSEELQSTSYQSPEDLSYSNSARTTETKKKVSIQSKETDPFSPSYHGNSNESRNKQQQKGFKAWMKAKDENKHELGKSYVVSPAQKQTRSESPLSPDQFDDVADRIANRVKNELHLSSAYDASKYTKQHQPMRAEPAAVNHSYQSDVTDEGAESTRLSSHVCPQCQELMVDQQAPILIIPCGHSVCATCAEGDDLCPICSCEIRSLTANITLRNVIADFVRQSRVGSRANSRAKQQREPNIDYSEELKSLMLRLEVLESECDVINDVIRVIQQDIRSEQTRHCDRQIERIEADESNVRREMDNLSRKLDHLSASKQDFRDNIESLEERRDKEMNKLHMVRETIRELSTSVEKIQLLHKVS